MKKVITLLAFFLLIPFYNSFPLFQQIPGLESGYIKRVVVSPFNPEVIGVASRNSLYKSQDGIRIFKRVAVFKDEEIQHIFFDSVVADTLYIVTSRHLYRFKDRLEELFSSSDDQTVFTAAKHKGVLYLGTSKGLRSADESSLIWQRVKALDDISIYFLDTSEETLYLATESGAYLLNGDRGIERLFVMRKEEESGEEGLAAQIIKVDIFNEDHLWLGTNQGLFVSEDKGINWRKLYIAGIDNLSINCIAQTKLQAETIYLGTSKGFFVVDLKRNSSKQLFEGLYSSYIYWAEFTPQGKIYLATSKGLFENKYFTSNHFQDNLEIVLEGEPSAEEIQETALYYNEVHPDKIRQWKQGLKYRALFPEVSLDFDKTVTTALGATYDRVQIGPQDWGVNLKWNVGDLLWNSYQDDVDTRARLNTQLRLDILDEINRVYFERLRLKREIDTSNLSVDDLFKKKLRLAELTAIIDGYTGGYLSQQTRKQSEAR
ncbi:MAG: hypothetical protein ABIE75_05020 [Candidatus Omnitrophota bacterium]